MDEFHTSKDDFIVVLDSRNATTYYNSTLHSFVRFDFADSIVIDQRAIKVECSLVQFDAPNSIYNINSTNCDLYISIGSSPAVLYSLPYGNYNINSFITAMSAILGSNFGLTYNTVTGRLRISCDLDEFTILGAESTLGSVMGFGDDDYDSELYVLYSPFTVNFNGLRSINVHLENINTGNVDNTSRSHCSLIGSVPINPESSIINYTKNYDFHFPIRIGVIDYLDISLRDNLYNLVDFNNQHWCIVLQFSIIHDLDRFPYLNSFHHILRRGFIGSKYPRF